MVQWWEIVVTLVCIFLSGVFSGLTLGVMSLDMIELRVLSESGSATEQWCARKIMPVRKHGNWLLCTLLMGNTVVNAALAIVSAKLFGGPGGLLASTAIILFAGEIIPQAVCYRHGLIIGAYAIPAIHVLMYLSAPLSYTTALALDFVLGGESATRYNRSQLKSLLSLHGQSLSPTQLQAVSSPSKVYDDATDKVIIEILSEAERQPQSEHQTSITIQSLPNPSSSPTSSPTDSENAANSISNDSSNPEIELNPDLPAETNASLDNNPSLDGIPVSDVEARKNFNLFGKFRKNRQQPSPAGSKRKERKEKLRKSLLEHAPLTNDEMTMLDGAFDFSQKDVGLVMTRLDSVFMLDASLSLNFKVLLLIFQSGHSRIPIYNQSRENIIGILFAKDLILLDPEDAVPIRTVLSFFNRNVLMVMEDIPLNRMLNIFCQGGGHMAIVRKEQTDNDGPLTTGIVTLEDLIEELIGQDIVDETDVYTDNLRKQRVKRIRSIDPEVLRMFDSTHDDEVLSEKEVLAVASYLSNNTYEFSENFVRIDVLRQMLAESPIIECHKEGKNGINTAQHEQDMSSRGVDEPVVIASLSGDDITKHLEGLGNDDATVYRKGVPSKNAYLIIHGRLKIIAGDEGFQSEAGPWTLLGTRALSHNLYAPDFTAKVIERPTRLLRISRKLFRDMVKASGTTLVPGASIDSPTVKINPFARVHSTHAPTIPNANSPSNATTQSATSLAMAAAATAMAVGLPKTSPNTSFEQVTSNAREGTLRSDDDRVSTSQQRSPGETQNRGSKSINGPGDSSDF